YSKASFSRAWAPATAFLATGLFGFIAFSPLLELPVNRTALSLLAVSPVLWAAMRCSQRDTAVCILVFSLLVVWGAWPANGPLGVVPSESFLISSLLVISASILALVISADVTQRQRGKIKLGKQEHNLRALLNHADIGIAQLDTSGQFKLVNTRYCDLV